MFNLLNTVRSNDSHFYIDDNNSVELANGHVVSLIEPIPLTSEIFKNIPNVRDLNYALFIGKLKFTINTIGKVKFHYSGKVVYIDYVHQLQNIVHALCGEELNITL